MSVALNGLSNDFSCLVFFPSFLFKKKSDCWNHETSFYVKFDYETSKIAKEITEIRLMAKKIVSYFSEHLVLSFS